MNIVEGNCKSALSPSHLPGLMYSLNPYRGCQHNCAYCYAPFVLRINRCKWDQEIIVKKNIPQILAQELSKKKPGAVGLSTVTDPYQPVEKKYELSRNCLKQLVQHDYPVSIQTKSALILRDLDVISSFSHAEVIISIGTLNSQESELLEPNASSIKQRLHVVKECSLRDLKTIIFFGPIYPTVSIEEIPLILDTFKTYGASQIIIDFFNLKPGIWENIKSSLLKDAQLSTVFSHQLLDDQKEYKLLKNQIHSIGKKKNLEIVDAF